jgi:ribosomal protein S12 methylthiotransferase
MPETKLTIISLGCAKALVDSEILLGGLKKNQFQITEKPEEADTVGNSRSGSFFWQ